MRRKDRRPADTGVFYFVFVINSLCGGDLEMKEGKILKKLLLAFVFVLTAISLAGIAPAYAQATRTWVSGVGDDVNPCSRTAPCKTFAGAISKTAARGVINCLDSGGFGAVTIVKSISIVCNGVIGGILGAGTTGITINLPAATDRVVLDGLDIDGAGTGVDGIRMIGLGQATIVRTSIQGFSQQGIDIVAGANARVTVIDSMIIQNAGGGINLQGNGAVVNGAVIDNVVLNNNTNYALQVSATGVAVISDSLLAGSTNSIALVPGANVISYGGNIIRNAGAPTQTLVKQ